VQQVLRNRIEIMESCEFPKITFGIIVLNGEPFTRYCLRSIYPYAHEIIVVEGGHKDAWSVCTPDGHSIDGTLAALYKFKEEEDSQNKVTIVTRNGFWPKKDELGNDRTPQSRAYAEIATGDYLWQIDIDEFYREEDMERIIRLLQNEPSITAITFPTHTFWGDINYVSDSWALRRGEKYYHRLFKWSKNYKYLTHEPPTILDENGIDLRQKYWVSGEEILSKKIFMYHYSLLFPWQVEQKVKVYQNEKPDECSGITEWAEKNYFRLGNPYRVHNLYRYPSWLIRFRGKHPEQILCMMRDIKNKKINARLRRTDDVEILLSSKKYKINSFLLKVGDPVDQIIFQLSRIKNIPNRMRKIYFKYKLK
jgi:hypothetical protein